MEQSQVARAIAGVVLAVTTQNVRLGIGPAHVRHDIGQAANGSGVVMTQEMRDRNAARFRPPGWGSAQPRPRGAMRSDCATFFDRSRWRLVRAWAVPYEFGTFRHGHRWALVTVLRRPDNPGVRVAFVNVHSVPHSIDRAAVYGAGMARLSRLGARLAAAYGLAVVGGDTNRVWPLRARFSGFHSVGPPGSTGPHGGRVDYIYAAGFRFRGVRVIGNTYSDHNGTRYRLVSHAR